MYEKKMTRKNMKPEKRKKKVSAEKKTKTPQRADY